MPISEIHIPETRFPDAARFASSGSTPHPALARGDFVGLSYLGTALKMPTASTATLQRYVGDLIETQRFPLPNPRRLKGRIVITGAGVVTARSLWTRAEVDHWFACQSPGGHTPSGAALPQDTPQRAAEVDDIISRRLTCIQGGRA